MIDAHVHADQMSVKQLELIQQDDLIEAMLAVSTGYNSCFTTLHLSKQFEKVIPLFGWHPEQPYDEQEIANVLQAIDTHQQQIIGIGEIGLPYYSKLIHPSLDYTPYIEAFEQFIKLAKRYELPVNLHIVHEDTSLALDILEKHSIKKAHFHWYKGPEQQTERLLKNGYFISITPDIVYKERTRQLVRATPLSQLMIESDAPYPLEGPFVTQDNHPLFISHTLQQMSEILQCSQKALHQQLCEQTKNFYLF